jgi:FkbH-like protein
MDSLGYLGYASRLHDVQPDGFGARIKINLVTNFTDEILKKILAGVCLHGGVYPTISAAPYKQYHLVLKNPKSAIYAETPDITFMFFHMSPYARSEFQQAGHFKETLGDIERYCEAVPTMVVLNTFPTSYQSAFGNLFEHDQFFKLVREHNTALRALASRIQNLHILDTDRLVHVLGESHAVDLRGLHAFDVPFSHEFLAMLAEEWFAHIRALLGKSKKCIVVDLDNVLWGGVVGELGPLGIVLGPEYPGSAFVSFQRTLLDFHDRGIMLAVNSKNNLDDVMAVFEKNPHMVLRTNHFAAIRANWNDKADNLLEIANELNIGTESMVFLDDDPLNRRIVEGRLPEVSVPDFSLPPEAYAHLLNSLKLFHQFSLTEEDKQRGNRYAEERERKRVLEKTGGNIEQYIAELGIAIQVALNGADLAPRLSQLTLKTNQFNMTTRRYTESDINKMMENGAMIFSGNVSDAFGEYGTVVMAIVLPDAPHKKEAALDVFLMSCRVMGRGIEHAFMDHIIKTLARRRVKTLHATFIATPKNQPAGAFFADHGFVAGQPGNAKKGTYSLDVLGYLKKNHEKVNTSITITTRT